MINRSAKGKRSEKKTEKYFMFNHAFMEWENVKPSKFGKTDLFGLWDHIAIASENTSFEVENIDNKKDKFPMSFVKGDILFIQTKTNRRESRNAMQGHIDFNVNQHKLLVIWKDREEEPRLISLNR